MEPIVGRVYRARGFKFCVHRVIDGEVFLARWRDGENKTSSLIRVDLDVWLRDTKEAEIVEDRP